MYVHYKSLDSAISAYNTLNARYYAGKQIFCEFAGVTKWKVAICGEFMKSRLKTCSHGSACNFIHCFSNPGGDYEWANWDNPPPRFWIKKMVVLFGASVESSYEKELESDDYNRLREPKRMRRSRSYRHQSEMFHYNEMDLNYGSSDEDKLNSNNQYIRHSITREHSSKVRGPRVSADKNEQLTRNYKSVEHVHSITSEHSSKSTGPHVSALTGNHKSEEHVHSITREHSIKSRGPRVSELTGNHKSEEHSSKSRGPRVSALTGNHKSEEHVHSITREHSSKSRGSRVSANKNEQLTGNHKSEEHVHSITREHSSKSRGSSVSADKNEQLTGNHKSEEHVHSRSFYFQSDETDEGMFEKHQRDDANMPQNCSRHDRRRENEDKSSSRRKREVYSEVLVNSESDGKSSSMRKRKIYSESESEDLSPSRRKRKVYSEEHENSESEDRSSSRRKMKVYSEEQDNSEIQDRSSSRRKRKVYSEEQENSECKGTSKSHKKHVKKHNPSEDHSDSFSKHSFGSQNQFDEKYSSEDLDTEKDADRNVYCYSSQSGRSK